MGTSLKREPGGSVVLRSDAMALRFIPQFGGTPLQWWQDGFPMLSNAYPGSGASVQWEVGQDPTQASANGTTQNPISCFDLPATWENSYWGRESLFDAGGCRYEVTTFCPDFLMSHEAIDDAICPVPSGDLCGGFRTKYAPGSLSAKLNWPSCPVFFQGTAGNKSGIMFVGNEMMSADAPLALRLRSYEHGRIAFKGQLSLLYAGAGAIGGFVFRKNIPATATTRDDAYVADGLHLLFNYAGDIELLSRKAGQEVSLGKVKCTALQKGYLLSEMGLPIEIRTNNVLREKIELWLAGSLVATFADFHQQEGRHFGLIGITQGNGYIGWHNRQPFDLGFTARALYHALPNGRIASEIEIRRPHGIASTEQSVFYRTNVPAIFLNGQTFAPGNRRCAVKINNTWSDFIGITQLNNVQGLYCGNKEGTAGIVAEIKRIRVNHIDSSDVAHALLDPNAANNEFVLAINALRMASVTAVTNISTEIEWSVKL